MQRYILACALQAVGCLLAVSIIVFSITRLTGDPTVLLLPVDATKEDHIRLTTHLGLDKPLYIQYWKFIRHAARGDFGNSLLVERTVTEIMMSRLAATLELGAVAILISLVIALPLGVYSAVKKDSFFDLGARMFAVLGQSAPPFILGLMLILVFSVWLRLLPAGGRGGLTNIIMPAVTLGYVVVAGIMRLMRSSMLDVLSSEYIKLARIKGLPERAVIWKHAFKNALLPVLTFSIIVFVYVLTGAVVTETVFAWPGIGRLAIESVIARDFPVVQGVVLFMAALFIAANFIVDILYAYLNPKIKHGR